MPGIAPVVGAVAAEVPRRQRLEPRAAHQQRVAAQQLGVALGRAGDADRREAERERGRPGRQVVDERQGHGHALLVRREAHDLDLLAGLAADRRTASEASLMKHSMVPDPPKR